MRDRPIERREEEEEEEEEGSNGQRKPGTSGNDDKETESTTCAAFSFFIWVTISSNSPIWQHKATQGHNRVRYPHLSHYDHTSEAAVDVWTNNLCVLVLDCWVELSFFFSKRCDISLPPFTPCYFFLFCIFRHSTTFNTPTKVSVVKQVLCAAPSKRLLLPCVENPNSQPLPASTYPTHMYQNHTSPHVLVYVNNHADKNTNLLTQRFPWCVLLPWSLLFPPGSLFSHDKNQIQFRNQRWHRLSCLVVHCAQWLKWELPIFASSFEIRAFCSWLFADIVTTILSVSALHLCAMEITSRSSFSESLIRWCASSMRRS